MSPETRPLVLELLPGLVHALAAVVGFAGLFVFCDAVATHERRGRIARRRPLTRFAERHHAYWGLLLLAAPTLPGAWVWLSASCWVLGAWWLCDDAHQHHVQLSDPFYMSPWHAWWLLAVRWLLRSGVSLPGWMLR